ncbi:hypothetical protein [Nocardioides daeguensis]|uniref:DUF1795 domain-containing protein n=1 Tax=Nocardioides daeguensis TaxID=908359 RepID=A0ABP6W9Z3_9ACTN|nr:hypothetical protein [Nocardioides daeguensis]MBV6727810.1 hypothetical protein [Nocardioides daeguensis]MCR1775281.1 hypothetical protein [Nocardioides daeguensis]
MRRRTRTGLLAAGACLALLLGACQDGGDPSPSPSRSPAADASTGSAAPSPTASAPSPAATGRTIETPLVSFRLPNGDWELDGDGRTQASYRETPDYWTMAVYESKVMGNATDGLDEVAEAVGVGDRTELDPPLVRGDNRVVDGVEGITASTTTANEFDATLRMTRYTWAAEVEGSLVELVLDGKADDPRTPQWFDAVLASVAWK